MTFSDVQAGPPHKFLFAMFQGGGNIPLIVPIVSRLVAAGHAVRILAGPGIRLSRIAVTARFRERVAAAGAKFVPLTEPVPHPLDAASPVRGLLGGWTPERYAMTAREARITLWSPFWAE